MIKINSKIFSLTHRPVNHGGVFMLFSLYHATHWGNLISMRKKYMSTPPFVTTEHDIDDDSGRKLQINIASSVCCSADGKTVYLADSTGLRKSEDGGINWEVLVPNE
ncbi:MAG: hypothetical protein HOD72_02465 [Opitutae bacterium]|jgi:hypothetical protein|nr:hypothetical protein [Opitutae bacterium]